MRISFDCCMHFASIKFSREATNCVCESHVGVQVSEDGFVPWRLVDPYFFWLPSLLSRICTFLFFKGRLSDIWRPPCSNCLGHYHSVTRHRLSQSTHSFTVLSRTPWHISWIHKPVCWDCWDLYQHSSFQYWIQERPKRRRRRSLHIYHTLSPRNRVAYRRDESGL